METGTSECVQKYKSNKNCEKQSNEKGGNIVRKKSDANEPTGYYLDAVL